MLTGPQDYKCMQNDRRILRSAQNCLLHSLLMNVIFKGSFWTPPPQPCTTCKTPSLTSVWVSQLGGSIMIPAVTDTGMSGRLSYTAPCLQADNAQPWHYLQYTMLQQPLQVPHTLCDSQLPQLLNIHEIPRSICACTRSVPLSHSTWHVARPSTCSCLVLSNSVVIRLFQITNLMHNSFIFQQYVCYSCRKLFAELFAELGILTLPSQYIFSPFIYGKE